jgi:hypothetical protein
MEFIKKYNIDDMGKTKIKQGIEVLGKYKIGKEIASGGYGSVYICENNPDKVIKVELVCRSPE